MPPCLRAGTTATSVVFLTLVASSIVFANVTSNAASAGSPSSLAHTNASASSSITVPEGPSTKAADPTTTAVGPKATAGGEVRLSRIETAPSCKTKLMVMIVSDVRQPWKREALRSSWALELSDLPASKVRFFFLVGRLWDAVPPSVIQEADEFQDIVIAPTNDFDFSEYTRKVILGMQLAARNCRFEYFLKVTEFSFVNMYTVGEWVEKLPSSGVFRGHVIQHAVPQRNPNSAWYISAQAFDRPHYPPYTQHVYLLSQDVVSKAAQMTAKYLAIYYDDVAVAVWLSDHDIHPVHDTAVTLQPDCQSPVNVELAMDKLALFGENMRDRANHVQCYVT